MNQTENKTYQSKLLSVSTYAHQSNLISVSTYTHQSNLLSVSTYIWGGLTIQP